MLLAINTTLRSVEVALIDGSQVIAEISEPSDRTHAEKIFEFIKEVLAKGGIEKENYSKNISDVLVVTGPGPFTSIRVGVVTANVIAYASQAHIYSTTLYDLFSVEEQELPLFVSGGKSEIFEVKDREEFEKNEAKDFFNQVSEEFFADFGSHHMEMVNTSGKADLIKQRELTFGQAAVKIFEQKLYTKGSVEEGVKPLYLKAPNISTSKKEI